MDSVRLSKLDKSVLYMCGWLREIDSNIAPDLL